MSHAVVTLQSLQAALQLVAVQYDITDFGCSTLALQGTLTAVDGDPSLR